MNLFKDLLFWLTCLMLSVYYFIDPFILVFYAFLSFSVGFLRMIQKIEEIYVLKQKQKNLTTISGALTCQLKSRT